MRLLIAEDELWIRKWLVSSSDWASYGISEVYEAEDGGEALEIALEKKPDIVITDIRMPELSGIDLMKKLNENSIFSKMIVVSGYDDFEYAQGALRMGAINYLLKPVDEEELITCLEKVKEKLDNLHGEALSEETEEGYRSEGRLLKEILQYIKDNYRTVTQQQLAEEFGMSISSVSQMIKKRTGKSYSDHLLEIRICKAQELLRLTNESIEDISEKVGYSDYFYFLKVFKKATGISPSVFRRNLS